MMDDAPFGGDSRRSGIGQELALGFVYWLALVVVLEPGNVLRGATLPLWWEAMRLAAAGMLGAAVTPAVFALTRRFPIEGAARGRRALIHLAGDAGLAVGLIAVAGVLAALAGLDRRPLAAALRDQLTVDGLLLFFATLALTGIAHAVLFTRRAQSALPAPAAPVSGYLTMVPVKARGRVTLLPIAEVEWIESQGNYLALHAGGAVHLIRETSARFETLLDPKRFARIHRQSIVALGRVRAIASLPSGDATVEMMDGTELRMSRSYRETMKAKMEVRR